VKVENYKLSELTTPLKERIQLVEYLFLVEERLAFPIRGGMDRFGGHHPKAAEQLDRRRSISRVVVLLPSENHDAALVNFL